jgi:hypothetical protein
VLWASLLATHARFHRWPAPVGWLAAAEQEKPAFASVSINGRRRTESRKPVGTPPQQVRQTGSGGGSEEEGAEACCTLARPRGWWVSGRRLPLTNEWTPVANQGEANLAPISDPRPRCITLDVGLCRKSLIIRAGNIQQVVAADDEASAMPALPSLSSIFVACHASKRCWPRPV